MHVCIILYGNMKSLLGLSHEESALSTSYYFQAIIFFFYA